MYCSSVLLASVADGAMHWKSAGNLYLDISVIPLVGNDPDSTELISLTWSHFILVFRCLLWLLRRQITSCQLQCEFH